MSVTNLSEPRYNRFAQILHWLMAILVFGAALLGLLNEDVPKAWRGALLNTHYIFGFSVLVLAIVRLALRQITPPPPYPAPLPPWQKTLSTVTHAVLYGLMLLVPVIGLITLFYRGRGIDFGLFVLPSPVVRTVEIAKSAQDYHEFAAYIFFGFIALHLAGSLFHHFILKDGLILRMMPQRKFD